MTSGTGTIQRNDDHDVRRDWSGHAELPLLTGSEVAIIFDTALELCSIRSGKPTEDILDLIRDNDVWANSTLRYAIAKEIRKALRANPKVRDLYTMGSVMEDRAKLTSDIDMVLHVESGKKNFETWLAGLDESLLKLFREHFDLDERFRSLLDCRVVTDEEVSSKIGYGSLLTSAYAQLTRIS